MLKAFCITLRDNTISENAYYNLCRSNTFFDNKIKIEKYNAITPSMVDEILTEHKINWNYPWDKAEVDPITNLLKSPYTAKNPKAKIACALSHYLLWKKCININEPILILEHDAIFIRHLDYSYILNSKYKIIGLNDPLRATRKANVFDSIIQSNFNEIQPVPRIDNISVPQGLAGNSAYVVTPDACKLVIDKVSEIGLWHNDALLCYQLFDFLGVTKIYYTKVQGTPSTTTS
jgi:GR25 family glycosyltransferase involved in LPS biosynthesis